jgi:uncharacterized protein YaaQ
MVPWAAGPRWSGAGWAVKLVVAVVQDYDADRFLRAATDEGLRATRIASTGGYLRTGNSTVLLGVADEAVGRCLELLAATSAVRVERASEVASELTELYASGLAEVKVGGAVAFVLRVERFEQFR